MLTWGSLSREPIPDTNPQTTRAKSFFTQVFRAVPALYPDLPARNFPGCDHTSPRVTARRPSTRPATPAGRDRPASSARRRPERLLRINSARGSSSNRAEAGSRPTDAGGGLPKRGSRGLERRQQTDTGSGAGRPGTRLQQAVRADGPRPAPGPRFPPAPGAARPRSLGPRPRRRAAPPHSSPAGQPGRWCTPRRELPPTTPAPGSPGGPGRPRRVGAGGGGPGSGTEDRAPSQPRRRAPSPQRQRQGREAAPRQPHAPNRHDCRRRRPCARTGHAQMPLQPPPPDRGTGHGADSVAAFPPNCFPSANPPPPLF